MRKKKSYLGQLWYDFWHIGELMPTKVNIYFNEEEGIEAFEIEQPENQYVPAHIQYFEDKKKGIFKLSMNNNSKNKKLDSNKGLIKYDEEE